MNKEKVDKIKDIIIGVLFVIIFILLIIIVVKVNSKDKKEENTFEVNPIISTFIGESEVVVPFKLECNNEQSISFETTGKVTDNNNKEVTLFNCGATAYWSPVLNEDDMTIKFSSNEKDVPIYNFVLEKNGNSYFVSLK